MPIYEYRCESCGHELDALQKLSESPLRDCPGCQAPSLRRLISAPSFRLKGEGWYETDFKSEKEKKRNLVESPADGKSEKAAKKDEKSPDGKTSKKVNLGSDSDAGAKSGSKSASAAKSGGSGSAAA